MFIKAITSSEINRNSPLEGKKEGKGGTNQLQFGCFVKSRRLQSKFFYFHEKKFSNIV